MGGGGSCPSAAKLGLFKRPHCPAWLRSCPGDRATGPHLMFPAGGGGGGASLKGVIGLSCAFKSLGVVETFLEVGGFIGPKCKAGSWNRAFLQLRKPLLKIKGIWVLPYLERIGLHTLPLPMLSFS